MTTAAGRKMCAKIRHLKPCKEALTWLARQRSEKQAWDACPVGEFMTWLMVKCGMLTEAQDYRLFSRWCEDCKDGRWDDDAGHADWIRARYPNPPKIPRKRVKRGRT
jgi:hypothetical protein